MKIKFIPLDYDYIDIDGKAVVRVFGRTSEGKRCCIIDSCEAFFWVIPQQDLNEKQIEKLAEKIKCIKSESAGRSVFIERVECCDKKFLGKPIKALKVVVSNPKDMHVVADIVKEFNEVEMKREIDIPYITRYIIEKNVLPMKWHFVEGEVLNNSTEFKCMDANIDVDLVIKTGKISPSDDSEFLPKVMAFDIEADNLEIGKGNILMLSMVCGKFKKVLTWKKFSAEDYVEFCKDEAEMIEKFCYYVKNEKPDILAGYFSDGFDLPYLRARAEKNNVKLELGLDSSQPLFARGRIASAKIIGLVHIDLFRFIETAYSQYLQSETLSLDEVASELIGERKHEFKNHSHSKESIKEHEWKDYFAYNLQDSLITEKLFHKLWPDLLEFTRVMQEPLFNVSRDTFSQHVENYIIHNLNRFNEIAEHHPTHEQITERRARQKYEGAFVLQPKPALYENLAVFDFTSLYPSLIVSFNLSLSTFLGDKRVSNAYEIPELELEGKKHKFYFSKQPGFIPSLLKEVIEKRRQAKQELKKNFSPLLQARSNAFKTLANATYGYFGFFGARYYCVEAAASTAALGRKFIHEMIEKTNSDAFNVIYADSVGGKTKVIVKENEEIREEEIENLFEKVDKKDELGREYNFKEKLKVLALDKNGNSIFRPVKYVMRHNCKKKMYRVNFTNKWYIDVTEDHSLIGYQSEKFNQTRENKENPLKRIIEVKPKEIGKKLKSIITLRKIPYENEKTKGYPKEVYEFLGYFIGDGSFDTNIHGKDYYVRISAGKDLKEVVEKLINPLKEKGYVKNIIVNEKNDIRINGLKLVNLICESCKKGKEKIIPEWLIKEKEEDIASFLRGLFSADGSVMMKKDIPEIKYNSVNEEYIKEVRKLLYRVGVSHSVFRDNTINKYKTKNRVYSSGSYSINIWIKDKKTFAEKIGFILERKNKLCCIKTDSLRKRIVGKFGFDIQNIKNVKRIETPQYVYDIEVEENHTFFANYILAHNTDGFSFSLNEKSKDEALNLLKKLNSELPGMMELELEAFYKRGIFVTKRTGEFGAKKKYALLNEKNQLKVRGFETVRRDWCDLAREVQNNVLEKILKEGSADSSLAYVKGIVSLITKRRIEKEKLVIRTQLKKSIEEYVSEGPHVAIAKRMISKGMPVDAGMLIEFYIAEGKGKKNQLIRERAKLPDEAGDYDIDYYIEHQIVPAVENIFAIFGITKEDLIEKKQKKLHEF